MESGDSDPGIPPYPPSQVLGEPLWDWSTHRSQARGDNWPITWADDDHQYAAWGDGSGFGPPPVGETRYDENGVWLGRRNNVYLGIARIEGPWANYRGFDVWGNEYAENLAQFRGKSYGIVCIDGILYMWVNLQHEAGRGHDQFDETRLAASTNHGATWTLADWGYTRSQNDVIVPTICNYARDYAGARDEYVYHYTIRHRFNHEETPWWKTLTVQKPGMIDLIRVHKSRIMDKNAHQFFAGLDHNGEPAWTSSGDPVERRPVFEDVHGVGWCVSVSFLPGLGRYLLMTEHQQTHANKLGIFDAPEPWGPWTTVAYYDAWGAGQIPLTCYYWTFAPKWHSPDGMQSSVIFSGQGENYCLNTVRIRHRLQEVIG